MKVEIKIERLLNRIEIMKQEVLDLEQSLVDPSKEYMDEAPPVALTHYKGDGLVDTDAEKQFVDHPVARGIQY